MPVVWPWLLWWSISQVIYHTSCQRLFPPCFQQFWCYLTGYGMFTWVVKSHGSFINKCKQHLSLNCNQTNILHKVFSKLKMSSDAWEGTNYSLLANCVFKKQNNCFAVCLSLADSQSGVFRQLIKMILIFFNKCYRVKLR